MPNKLNKEKQVFLPQGITIPFFVSFFKIGKNADSIRRDEKGVSLSFLKFVWRQSEFAFFGALTSVGALFYFIFISGGKENEKN